MGLDRRIRDASSIKNRQQIMETSGRRWTTRVVENVNALSGTRLPTSSEPTTHQKVRRILEEQAWKKRDNIIEKKKNSTCVFTNYNIVPRGNLSHGTFTINDSTIVKKDKTLTNEYLINSRKEEIGRIGREKKINNWEKRRDQDRIYSRSRSAKSLSKISSSTPINLKDGLETSTSPTKPSNDGILKRSSAFLERLTGDKKESPKSLLRNIPVSKNLDNNLFLSLKKSPSCQSFSSRNNNCHTGVKKSVSFSLDTAFEGNKKNSLKKNTIHESKIYRKGVLRDLNDIDTLKKPEKKMEETMSLLRAAKESDELSLSDLIIRMRRSGLGKIDVNATDSSGRSVISYIAGNGAAEILETLLSFSDSNPNLPDNEGNTPLHFAAQAGQVECLNILLQRSVGIELDARNVLGFTPLMKAAVQGRTKCAKILLFAGANPTLRDHGRGLRAEQWSRYCGRHICADTIERFSRHRLIDRTSCRWGSEPELATKVLQGKIIPVQQVPIAIPSSGIKSKLKRVFRTNGHDKNFSLASQLTSAALCASTPALPKPGDIPPVVKSYRPLSVPQLRVTLVAPTEILEKSEMNMLNKMDSTIVKPSRSKKKSK